MLLAEERDLCTLISGPARDECARTSGASISHVGGGLGGGVAQIGLRSRSRLDATSLMRAEQEVL